MQRHRLDPDWLLDCEPRQVQIEALRRSVAGFALMDGRDSEPLYRPMQPWVRGWGHWLEMRLGKTPTSLAENALFVRDKGIKRVVVFSPNSYKEDWCSEAEKYGFELPAIPYESGKHNKVMTEIQRARGQCMLVVNYEAISKDKTFKVVMDFVDGVTKIDADESIKLKNPESQTTKAAIQISKEAGVTRTLTGLPMTQGPQDLYGQIRFMRRLSGKNYFAFRNKYCKMGGFKGKQIKGVKNEEELQELLSGMSFVAKKKDWSNPTNPEHYVVKTPLSGKQQQYYSQMDNDFLVMIESAGDFVEVTAEMVVSKLMKLQQISSGFLIDENKKVHILEDPRKTAKMKRLLEMLEDEIPGKVVIPFHYSASGDVLLETLKKYNPCVIRGQAWMKKNERDVRQEKLRFNQDPGSRIMLAQIVATKYGHDLTGVEGYRCEDMLFYESTYSLDDRSQLERRITAAVQNWVPRYHDFVSSKVEENAAKALARKESVVDAVIGSYK